VPVGGVFEEANCIDNDNDAVHDYELVTAMNENECKF